MEIIRKIVNIRDFTEKFGAHEPYINLGEESGKTSYGKIPYDIVVSGDTYVNIPIVEVNFDGVKKTVIRFGTFAYYYNWFRNFIDSSRYYYAANPKGVFTWVEFDPLLPVFPESGVCSEDLTKYCIFSSCEGVYSGLPEESSAYTCEETFVCVNEDADTFVEMFVDVPSACNFWNFANSYVLNGGYAGEITMSPPFLEIPVAIDTTANDLGSEEYVEPKESKDSGVTVSGVCECFTESRLKTLLRQKTTVDDEGNILDFVAVNKTESGITRTINELCYSIGTPQGFVYDSNVGAYTFNRLEEVFIQYEDDESGQTMYSDDDIQWDDISYVGRTGKIQFYYTVGNLLLDPAESASTDGVGYFEEYSFTIKKSSYNNLPYLSIGYDSGIKPEQWEIGKLYAIISYDFENVVYYNESGEPAEHFIRRDTLIGSTEVGLKSDEIKIDRGASAAYEAFNVLGEVNSIEDIEKYRNDWYQIKGKND